MDGFYDAGDVTGRMSDSEAQDASLLGHENKDAMQRWEKEKHNSARIYRLRSILLFWMLVVVVGFLLSAVLYLLRLQYRLTAISLQSGESTRDLKILLHPEDHVSRGPGVTRYLWNITKGNIAPDGVHKDVFLINNGFPGPVIEARSGDTLEIEILNNSEEYLSLHWHGLHMRGANNMDGAVGISQCAIKPGHSFTYKVPIGNQAGTFWYHAHSELQRGDGLYGGLVVHDHTVHETEFDGFDEELLFLVGDWYHRQSADVFATYEERTSEGKEPGPDSLLVNGKGYFDCSMATHGAPVDCDLMEKPWLHLDKRRRYRIRLVNVGSMTGISFTLPDGALTVLQVDGGQSVDHNASTGIANSVGILYPGERVDFITAWSNSDVETKSEIIIQLDKEYFLRPNFALTPTQSFIILADSPDPKPSSNRTDIRSFNLGKAKGPLLSSPLPDPQRTFMVYSSILILNHLNSIPKAFINNTTWEPQARPLLSLPREDWDDHQLVPWTGSKPVWVELTINNQDNNGHPYHLHGYDFYVIASYEGNGGWDYYNPFSRKPPRGGDFNLVNPLRKDTVYVPQWGYTVLRFLADNEGIWALHCHILWAELANIARQAGNDPIQDHVQLGDIRFIPTSSKEVQNLGVRVNV